MKVAGFGYRCGATLASLKTALALAGHADRLATASDKDGSLARTFAKAADLPLILIPPETIALQTASLSSKAPSRYGGRSLAEAAALAGAGPGALIVVGRIVSPDGMATVAIAEGTGRVGTNT
jgi:cobalt-precorrin 5A hydrolase